MALCGHQESIVDCRMCWTTLLAQNERLRAESRMLAKVADRMREHEKKLDDVFRAASAFRENGLSDEQGGCVVCGSMLECRTECPARRLVDALDAVSSDSSSPDPEGTKSP